MKKISILAISAIVLIACGSPSEQPATPAAPVAKAAVEPSFVSPILYSYKFEWGDPKKAEQVVQLWKDFDDNTLDAHKDYFADSVSMEFVGSTFNGSLDSLISQTKAYRNSLPDVESKIEAVMSLHSTDKNEDWVSIWGIEYITHSPGKVDSAALHEIWRFNAAGKIDYMGQYRRGYAPAKK